MEPDLDWYLDNVLINDRPGVRAPARLTPTASWRSWWRAVAAELQQPGEPRPLAWARALAARQGFVVTTRQLRALGWADHDLRREVRRGTWWVPRYGVASPVLVGARPADEPQQHMLAARRGHAITASAAAIVRPDHVICGASAAVVHGVPTLDLPADPLLTTRGADTLGARGAALVRGATLSDVEVTTWFGSPVTTPARTLVDLGRHDRRDALAAADAALHAGLLTRRDIDAALARAAGWPGVRQARAVLALASPKPESPFESWLRLALHDSGFPPPELQYPIAGYLADFAWPAARLVVEADGLDKYTRAELRREKRRDIAMHRNGGWHVERLMFTDVFGGWASTERLLWSRYLSRLPR